MQYIQYTVYNTYNIQDMIQYNIQDLIHTIYRIQYILYTGYNTYNIQDTIHTVYRIQYIQYNVQCTQIEDTLQIAKHLFFFSCIWFQTINGIF